MDNINQAGWDLKRQTQEMNHELSQELRDNNGTIDINKYKKRFSEILDEYNKKTVPTNK